MEFRKLIYATLMVMMSQAALAGGAAALARVEGFEIKPASVEDFARLVMQHKGEEVGVDLYNESLQKVVANRAIYTVVLNETPGLVDAVGRSVDITLAKGYYNKYYSKVAYPAALKTVTLEDATENIPEQEAAAFVYVIMMYDRQELEKVRQEIVSGEIGFQDAAKKYSQGISGPKGGELAGLKPSDDRFTEEEVDAMFITPVGEVSKIVQGKLGNSIFYVTERKTAEEHKHFLAMQSMGGLYKAQAASNCWSDYRKLEDEGKVKLFLNAENTIGKEIDTKRPAFEIFGKTYYIADIVRGSGGLSSHGTKDILTIAENRARDLTLRELYIVQFGKTEEELTGRQLLVEHNVTRRYLKGKTTDLVVSDEAVDKYLEENQKKYGLPDRAEIGIIRVLTEYRLSEVKKALEAGKPFEDVARAWTQKSRYKNMGGKVGIVSIGQVGEGLESLEAGSYSEPIHIEEGEAAGYYIIKVYEIFLKEEGTRENLSPEVIGGVRSILLSKLKKERLGEVLVEMMSKVKVENLREAMRRPDKTEN